MLSVSPANRVFVALGPVGMRKSFNGLYAHIRAVLREDPLSGHLFVYSNRLRNRVKVVWFDGSGLRVWAKRLPSVRFRYWWENQPTYRSYWKLTNCRYCSPVVTRLKPRVSPLAAGPHGTSEAISHKALTIRSYTPWAAAMFLACGMTMPDDVNERIPNASICNKGTQRRKQAGWP